MLQLVLCCPRMNLLSFTLTTWKVERHSVLRTKAVNGYVCRMLLITSTSAAEFNVQPRPVVLAFNRISKSCRRKCLSVDMRRLF